MCFLNSSDSRELCWLGLQPESPINDYPRFADLVEMCLRWIYFDLLSSSQVNLYTHISY